MSNMQNAVPDEYGDQVASDGESIGDEMELKQESPYASPNGSVLPGKNAQQIKAAAHLQKRRRVTRACDECRRKKIKCDGKQPCTHCQVYSYECSYDQPSNRRRNPAPQYVENLEHRVHRAETLLHILIPNLDLNDPGIDAAVAQGWIPGAPGKGNPHTTQRPQNAQPPAQRQPAPSQPTAEPLPDTNIESMVRAVAQIDMDETGHWDYHGHSSGLSFVRRMREQLGDLMGPETVATPFIKSRPMSVVFDSPKSGVESPTAGEFSPSGHDLPAKALAMEICHCAVDDASALLKIVHKPTFWQAFEHLYSTPPDNWTNDDQSFLPLFYSVLALGHLFAKDEQSGVSREGYETGIQQGFVHFKTARQMMDIADCRDLMAIQAVMYMILFLQSSAKLSTCYAYVGVALRSALRMGLHRAHTGNFDPIEAETRKRVFWVVRKMDIYVGAMLGLPQTLSDDDIDQEFPLEIDDEYVTKERILPMPEGRVPIMMAFNSHTRLVQLLSKIVRYVYPIKVKGTQRVEADKSYSVPFSAIRELENDLENWKNSLPAVFSPSPAEERYTRIQYLLRLSYAHTQVMLYRPFLHFVAMNKREKPVDQRAYACAASYVNVSRNIVHITTEMKKNGLLNGAHWFTMYTSFFAILSLVYFAAENPDNPTTEAVMKDALEGKQILASLAQRSMAADRCTATLNSVFQRLPDWMRNGQTNPTINRKRPHDSGKTAPHVQIPQASRSHPDVSTVNRPEPTPGLKNRASTFPKHGLAQPLSISPASYDGFSQSGSSTMGPQTPNGHDFPPPNNYGMYQQPSSSASNALAQSGMSNHYSLPPTSYPNPAISDLSNMMFPSAADEPFGYPSQPLTTFETSQQFSKNNPYPASSGGQNYTTSHMDGITPASRGGRDDNMEAQFYALPPFMDQRQQPQPQQQQQQQQQPGMGAFGVGGIGGQQGMAPGGAWPGQQGQGDAMANINIQDIFGGSEWFGLNNPGGYQ
ncbi:Gypsy retrotransposon integrase-like protein 1 [Saxophila tyrrhenica]|uniref:Gypsy retrotransposon integrase-like protein 1 n=1 Tax=Saxophila tyrrhenica TaxID=1690608 RepID=A0AAV9PNG1_9PEZI|nr:Gypsy retrotransposon integrase-like protein 1 [Saxophila tyrrhenica]